MKPIVILESPYRGEGARNREYLAAALRDSLKRGEAPFASHALYTLALDDTIPAERELGITAGLEFYRVATKAVAYVDLGMSPGMLQGFGRARAAGVECEIRRLKGWAP